MYLTRKKILDDFFHVTKHSPSSSWSRIITSKYNIELFDNIKHLTFYLNKDCKVTERLYHLINNINNVVMCDTCHKNKVKFININRGYCKCCDKKCINFLEVQEKIKKTNMTRYGVENPFQSDEIKEKIKKTNLERYGVEHNSQCADVVKKRIHTLTQNYADNLDAIRGKYKKTNLERYGVEYPSQLTSIKKKTEKTNLERYGVKYYNQKHYNIEVKNLLNNIFLFQTELTKLGIQQFKQKYNMLDANLYAHIRKNNLTYNKTLFKTEEQIKNLLDKLNIEYTQNNRKIIKPFELDFYLPEHNMAIEVCGLYWHSELSGKDKKYHYNKWKLCNDNNIRLITIFEDELNKKEIIESRLTHILGKQTKKIHARKCIIKEILPNEARDFCNKHHIQGYVNSKIKIGAFHNNELVSVMTFGKLRKSMNQTPLPGVYELVRFCSSDYNINGIASRLFKYFTKNYNPESIISYSDLRWSLGDLYVKLGFKFIHNSPPNYWYMKNYKIREYRYKYRKNVLVESGFNSNKTEWGIMQERGYDRIWDCGNSKWVWQRDK